jgi:hypothetical protein
VLLSRPPRSRPKAPVRLACFRHAASVYPEPGSNSPSELSETIFPYWKRWRPTISTQIVTLPTTLRLSTCSPPTCLPTILATRRATTTCHYDRLKRSRSRAALAPTDCPTPLPAQYRGRWGVSRPCSGRERVGPPRWSHQGHRLDRHQASRPRAGTTRPGTAPESGGAAIMRTRGRSVRVQRWGGEWADPGGWASCASAGLSPRPLVRLRCTRCRACTCRLSTRWSTWGLTQCCWWGPSSSGELPA